MKDVITECCQKAIDARIIKLSELRLYLAAMTEEEEKELLGILTPRERKAVESDNLAEFGRDNGITRERARQIAEAAKMKLYLKVVSDITKIQKEPDPDYESIAKGLHDKKVRQYQLAEKLGISAPTLAGLLKGNIKMKPIDAYAIRKVGGILKDKVVCPYEKPVCGLEV